MMEMCGDNRFELITKYKQKLIDATNIETSPDEMAVLDGILFRCWQMGWLDAIEKQIPTKGKERFVGNGWNDIWEGDCPKCGKTIKPTLNWCPYCGQAIDWSDNE